MNHLAALSLSNQNINNERTTYVHHTVTLLTYFIIIIIIIIIINAKIKVTLSKEMLQGHFTKIIKTCCQSGKEALNKVVFRSR